MCTIWLKIMITMKSTKKTDSRTVETVDFFNSVNRRRKHRKRKKHNKCLSYYDAIILQLVSLQWLDFALFRTSIPEENNRNMRYSWKMTWEIFKGINWLLTDKRQIRINLFQKESKMHLLVILQILNWASSLPPKHSIS